MCFDRILFSLHLLCTQRAAIFFLWVLCFHFPATTLAFDNQLHFLPLRTTGFSRIFLMADLLLIISKVSLLSNTIIQFSGFSLFSTINSFCILVGLLGCFIQLLSSGSATSPLPDPPVNSSRDNLYRSEIPFFKNEAVLIPVRIAFHEMFPHDDKHLWTEAPVPVIEQSMMKPAP